jgi:hypothetical protein
VVPSLIFPLAVKIDGVAFKSSAPDQEATRRGRVCPRMFPLGGLRIEGAETEALDHRSLIGSLEEFQEGAAIQDLLAFSEPGPSPQDPSGKGKRQMAFHSPSRKSNCVASTFFVAEITSLMPTSQCIRLIVADGMTLTIASPRSISLSGCNGVV